MIQFNKVPLFCRLSIIGILILSATLSYGQGNISPYSVLGVGETVYSGNIRSMGMGGTSLALPSIAFSNTSNPALLPFNTYAMLDVNYAGEYRNYQTDTENTDAYSGNLLGLSLTFPVLKANYSMSVGIRPVTQVNYSLFTEEKLANTGSFVAYDYDGSGGISQAYWSHGVRLAKGLFAGLEMTYNFGSITNESKSTIVDPLTIFTTDIQERTTFSSVSFSPALNYNIEIDSSVYIGLGIRYDRSLDMSVDYTRQFLRQTVSGAIISSDTLRNNSGTVSLPNRISGGISIYRPFHYAFGIDAHWGSWSEYKSDIRSTNLSDAFRLSFGAEWTPDINSVSKYFKRVTYRMGAHYERTPWLVNNQQIDDFGISLGLSMPVSRGLSYLNWAFTAGQRGTIDNGLIQERYVKVGLGISINDPQWFRRRRIN